MIDVFEEAIRLVTAGRRGAIATIIETTGSTPGKLGAKMLVGDDGSTTGTVGGGCTEAQIWQVAMEVIATDVARRNTYRITAATAAETGLLCGGEFEVYVEPIGGPSVYIFGAGHIAGCLVPILNSLEYRSIVVDDRETHANTERFPDASEVLVRDFDNVLEGLPLGPMSYLVVVTRGHQHDEVVLAQAIRSEAGYVGLIGSRGKIGSIFKNLRESGVPQETLDRVYGPIGFDLGSKTPEEIAIAIAAELIAVRRGKAPPPRR